MQNFDSMNGPELIAAYNAMARSIEGGALGAREIGRFSNKEIGIKRCKALAEAIKARVTELEVGSAQLHQDPAELLDIPAELLQEAAFPARGSSLRTRLFNLLMDNINEQVSTSELVRSLYGDTRSDAGALGGVMKGVAEVIQKNNLGYQIRKNKNGREVSYGLYEEKS